MSATSEQRETARALVQAFNEMDVDKIVSLRDPACLRYIFPRSLGHEPQSNEVTKQSLLKLRTVFHNFSLTQDDIVEDLPARKVCLWLTARADTLVGEYVNEYVWNLDFSEDGKTIVGWKEFVDAGMKDFFPLLQRAYKEKAAKASAEAKS